LTFNPFIGRIGVLVFIGVLILAVSCGKIHIHMTKISTSDFKKGIFILFKNENYQIVESTHVNPGKGSAFVRVRLKSLKRGNVEEFTYKSGETVEEIPIETREMQYIYKENEKYVFMDPKSYEQYSLSKEILGEQAGYLKEGNVYQILVNNEEPLSIRFPKKVTFKVVEAGEGARGNTVSSGAKKSVKLENGMSVEVPLFIKDGEMVVVDTETGTYVERG